jgi:hypothetical protein
VGGVTLPPTGAGFPVGLSVGLGVLLVAAGTVVTLGVRRRQAIALLHRFTGYQVGRTFVVSREAVIEFLETIVASGAIAEATAKKRSVLEFLGEARQALQLPSIPLPAAKLSEITFDGLPSGIRLQTDQLTIHFASATDLLEKLFSLSQALANDFETLERTLAAGEFHGR